MKSITISLLVAAAIFAAFGPAKSAALEQPVIVVAANATATASNATINSTSTSSQQRQQQQQLEETLKKQEATNVTLVEALTERIVKQSNLQAEESQQVAALSVLPPPSSPSSAAATETTAATTTGHASRNQRPASFSGGSGNSYMSIARDGSSRYEFGFDTDGGRESTAPQRAGRAPRLMREESRLEDGTVIGRYGYTDPFNVFRIVQYVAGPDGYFATEDVGALASEGNASGKFQLNRQLYKALEQAKAERLARKAAAQTTSGQRGAHKTQKIATISSNSNKAAETLAEEPLSASASHQSVRFTSAINHLVGTDGVSYATAFRPVVVNKLGQSRQQQSSSSPPYEPVYSPQPAESVQRQHYEQLRSRLPAPIYAPDSFAFRVQHSQVAALPSADSDGAETRAASQAATAAAWSQPAASVLQASPAWSVLSNNYDSDTQLYHSALIIDHGAGLSSSSAGGFDALGSRVGHNFDREAAMLRSLRGQRRAQPADLALAQTATTNRVSPPATLAGVSPLATNNKDNRPLKPEFGARTRHWSEPTALTSDAQARAYNFGLALKQFDPPLYRPEVHETRPDEATSTAEPVAVYSSTVVHSELAAERDYRPERVALIGGGGNHTRPATTELEHNAADENLERSPSASMSSWTSANKQKGLFAGAGKPLIMAANVAESSESASEASEVRPAEPFDYAARLRVTPTTGSELVDDMNTEDSEQVAYLSGSNGTSRARLPDRSKKLSSMFKARTSASVADESDSRIRRPVPISVKRRQEQQPQLLAAAKQQSESSAVQSTATAEAEKKASERVVRAESKLTTPPSELKSLEQLANKESQSAPSLSVTPAATATATTSTTSTSTTSTAPPSMTTTSSEQRQMVRPTSTSAPFVGDLPTATIIDPTKQPGALSSPLDRALYAKIVKIQQEIRAKTEAATKLARTTTIRLTPYDNTATPVASTRIKAATTTSLESDEGSSNGKAATTVAPTTTGAPIKATSGDGLSILAKPVQSIDNSIAEPARFGESRELKEADKQLLTGPLVKIDTSLDQSEFLAKLTQDMDNFDSIREPAASVGERTTRQPELIASATTTLPSTVKPLGTATITATTVTQAHQTTQIPNLAAASAQRVPTPSPLDTAHSSVTQSGKGEAAAEGEAVTKSAVATSNEETSNVGGEVRSSEAKTSSPATSFERPSASIETTSAAPATRVPKHQGQPQASEVAATATTSTSTTEVAPTAAQTTTRQPRATSTQAKPSKRPTAQPRLGRLVIKRGDKVVARFNGSAPIPDSMIPVNGNGSEVVVPDMPRLGMRRSVKKVISSQAQPGATTEAHTAPSSPSTTTTDKPLESAASVEAQSPAGSSQTKETNSSSRGDGQTNATVTTLTAGGEEPRRTRGLLRGTRSSSARPEANDGDLMASESRASLKLAPEVEDPESTAELDGELRKISALKQSSNNSSKLIVGSGASAPQPANEVNASSAVAAASSTPVQSSQVGASVTESAGRVGRNWSSRLRDSINSGHDKQTTSKKYDAQEDLRKLVAKISSAEGRGPSGSRSKQPTARLAPAMRRRETASQPAARALELRRQPKNTKLVASTESTVASREQGSTGASSRPHTTQQTTTTTTTPPTTTTTERPIKGSWPVIGGKSELASNNLTEPKGTTEHTSAKQQRPLSANSSTAGNQTVSLAKAVEPMELNSVPMEQKSSGIQEANSTTLQATLEATNLNNVTMLAGSGESKANLTLATQSSLSSSASFMVALSPTLERHWEQLRPANASLVAKNLTSAKQAEVRVDSHGHIHVRNNQSITVHIDIEPPPRSSSLATSSNADQSLPVSAVSWFVQPKRLVGRDTAPASSFGRDDIQRIPGLRTKLNTPEHTGRPRGAEPIDVNYPPALARLAHQVEASPASSQAHSSQARPVAVELVGTDSSSSSSGSRLTAAQQIEPALARRKPRMLCIEVESDSAQRQTTRTQSAPMAS